MVSDPCRKLAQSKLLERKDAKFVGRKVDREVVVSSGLSVFGLLCSVLIFAWRIAF